MSKKKKTKNSKKKSENSSKTLPSEGDMETEKSCETCHFLTNNVVNEDGYCKRHREYLRILKRKQVLSETEMVCCLWHANLR